MSDTEKMMIFSPNAPIKIIKWKVREGFQVKKNNTILQYELTSGNNTKKDFIKSNKCGVAKKRFYKEGDVVEPG